MERVKKGDYGSCTLYICVKNKTMKPVEIVLRMGRRRNERE
jgi:hypothetical protein